MDISSVQASVNGVIAVIDTDEATYSTICQCNFGNATVMQFKNGLELNMKWEKSNLNIIGVISQSEAIAPLGVYLYETLQKNNFPDVPFFLIANKVDANVNKICMQTGIADAFKLPLKREQIETRVNFLINNWKLMQQRAKPEKITSYKVPLAKRIFDIFFSGMALIML